MNIEKETGETPDDLLIEPVWNRNPADVEETDEEPFTFNRTSLE